MNNSNLNEKVDYYSFFMIYKNKWNNYYQRKEDLILKRVKEFYKNNKKRLKEQARSKYRELSEEEKNIKREYRKNRYDNTSEEK